MNQHETTSFYRGKLPHWEVANGTYIVTIRLWGTLPARVEKELRRLSNLYRDSQCQHKDRLALLIDECSERWLNSMAHFAHLRDERVATLISEAIEHHATKEIWHVHEYVIMPSHLHLLISVGNGSLRSTLLNFKKWTGKQAIKALNLQGQFWQNEWFDHWVRTHEEFAAKIDYIRQNPVVAGLATEYSQWPYASWAQRKEAGLGSP